MALLGMNNYMISNTLIAFLVLSALSKHTNALLPTDSKVDHFCRNATFDTNQQNKLSTTSLLSDLVSHSSSNSFYSSSSSASGPNMTTYGLFYCTANVDSNDCHNCVQNAASDAKLDCPFHKGAVFFYTDCTLRYSNATINATPDESMTAWRHNSGVLSIVPYTGFNSTLYDTLSTLINEAAHGSGSKGYATGEAGLEGTAERLYALAQCTPDILGSPCQECLEQALVQMPRCCDDDIWGPKRNLIMTFLPSCQLRYEVKYPSTSHGIGTLSYAPGKIVWYIMVGLVAAAL